MGTVRLVPIKITSPFTWRPTSKQLNAVFAIIECFLLIGLLVLMAMGPGLHLRQAWRAYDHTTGHLIECGTDLLLQHNQGNKHRIDIASNNRQPMFDIRKVALNDINSTNTKMVDDGTGTTIENTSADVSRRLLATPENLSSRSSSTSNISTEIATRSVNATPNMPLEEQQPTWLQASLCRLEVGHSLPVDSMTGYFGAASIDGGLWHMLHMFPQYVMFLLLTIVLLFTLLILYPPSPKFTRVVLIASAVTCQSVVLVTCYSSNCLQHKRFMQDKMHKEIISLNLHERTESKEIAVHCFVGSFFCCALLCQAVTIIYTIHSYCIYRLEDFSNKPAPVITKKPIKTPVWKPIEEEDNPELGSLSADLSIDHTKTNTPITMKSETPKSSSSADESGAGTSTEESEEGTNEQNNKSSTTTGSGTTSILVTAAKAKRKERVRFGGPVDGVEVRDEREKDMTGQYISEPVQLCLIPEKDDSRTGGWDMDEFHFRYEEPDSETSLGISPTSIDIDELSDRSKETGLSFFGINPFSLFTFTKPLKSQTPTVSATPSPVKTPPSKTIPDSQGTSKKPPGLKGDKAPPKNVPDQQPKNALAVKETTGKIPPKKPPDLKEASKNLASPIGAIKNPPESKETKLPPKTEPKAKGSTSKIPPKKPPDPKEASKKPPESTEIKPPPKTEPESKESTSKIPPKKPADPKDAGKTPPESKETKPPPKTEPESKETTSKIPPKKPLDPKDASKKPPESKGNKTLPTNPPEPKNLQDSKGSNLSPDSKNPLKAPPGLTKNPPETKKLPDSKGSNPLPELKNAQKTPPESKGTISKMPPKNLPDPKDVSKNLKDSKGSSTTFPGTKGNKTPPAVQPESQEPPESKSSPTNPSGSKPLPTNPPEPKPLPTNPPEPKPLPTNPPKSKPLPTNPPEFKPSPTNPPKTSPESKGDEKPKAKIEKASGQLAKI